MKIVYSPPFDLSWFHSLSPWQHETLADLHRQGKHLPDRTNHGSDWRWRQAGCKTRERFARPWRRNPRRSGHERILILRTDYGYEVLAIRRETAFVVDPDTGEISRAPEAWTITDRWYVEADKSANYPPRLEAA